MIERILRAFDDGRQRAELYRMWRVGLAGGLTHEATLAQVGHFRGVTAALHAHLLDGARARKDVARMVRERPALFEPFEAALLTVGEESGRLEAMLGDLAQWFERSHRMMLVVKKRMMYPAFVTLVAIWLGPLPLVFRGQTRAYVVAVIVGILGWFFVGGALLAGRMQAYLRKPPFVRARFARTLALTIDAGLPNPRALTLAAGASGDSALATHVAGIGERRLASQSLEQSLAGAANLTPEFVSSLRVAEATGDMRNTLLRLAELYEDGFH